MATGRWNHTAYIVACQVNLMRVVAGLFGGKVSLIGPQQVHPYRFEKSEDKLKKEFIQRMQEISARLPREERSEARAKLIAEFRKQSGHTDG